MELVYLWVEEYKNIHRQGFNFSPRFECKYENNELTICDKKKKKCKDNDYIENFFGDNINVTAIVGKNGSGKSSIAEILEDIQMSILSPGYLLLFMQGNEKYILSDLNDSVSCSRTDIIMLEKTRFNFLTYSAEMPYPYFEEKKLRYKNDLRISFEQRDIFKIMAKYIGKNIELTSFMFVPEIIEVTQNDELLEEYINIIRPEQLQRNNNPEHGLPYEDCHDIRDNYNTKNILEAFFFMEIVENDLSSYLCNKNFFNEQHQTYDSNILENFYNNSEYELNEKQYSLDEFNRLIETVYYDKETLTEENIQLLQKYSNFLIFNFEDSMFRKYSDLSHGEKSIFGQFLHIYDRLKVDNDLCVILDEPDISLHPNWQKKYISEIEKSFFNLEKNIHFIITTHSPFLLSDIPKQNIIFLDTYEDGKCKVLHHDEVMDKKQTFGQNIHTLLSDSFFMEDGLMGEFAKGKIDKIIKFLREDSIPGSREGWIDSKKNLKRIIDSIGEPFLRHKILELYYDKFKDDATKAERRKELEKQKEQIERELSHYD